MRESAKLGHVDHTRPLPRDGVDYAFGRIAPAVLRQHGVTFVVRYIASGGGKDISRTEAEDISGAGMGVVLVHETSSGRMLAGYEAGMADAKRAAAAAREVRQPGDRPIYFACDFDAQDSQIRDVCEYLRGAVHAIGWHRVGLYAGRRPIESAASLNRCRYYWQTLAWSYGAWSPHAQLRQIAIERTLGGSRVDLDRAVAADFGQWRSP